MLARKSLLIITSNVFGAFLGLIALVAVGRFMTPSAFGMLGVAIGITGLFSFIGNLGFDKANTKRLSEGLDQATCLGTYHVIKTWLAGGYMAIMLVIALVWHTAVGFTDSTAISVVLIAILYHGFINLRNYPLSTFNAYRMSANSQAMAVSENLVKAPLIVMAAIAFGLMNGRWSVPGELGRDVSGWFRGLGPVGNEFGAVLLAVAYTLGMFSSLAVGWFQMRRFGMRRGRYDRALASRYKAFALPMALMVALMVIAKQIDIVMIGYFWSAAESGHYFAAERFTTLILIVPIAVRTLFFPLISEMSMRGDTIGVNDAARTTQRTMSLVMVLATMFVLLYAHEVIEILLDPAFLPAAPVLQLMALYVLVFAFSSIESSIVMGFDRPRINALVAALSVLLNVALNLVFIPTSILGVPLFGMGATGAVVSTVIAQTLVLVLMLRESHRITRRFHYSWSIPKHFMTAGITAGILHLAHDRVLGGVDTIWELAFAGILGSAIYVAVLIVLFELKRKDWVMAVDLLHPGKMAGYVRSELKEGHDRPADKKEER